MDIPERNASTSAWHYQNLLELGGPAACGQTICFALGGEREGGAGAYESSEMRRYRQTD